MRMWIKSLWKRLPQQFLRHVKMPQLHLKMFLTLQLQWNRHRRSDYDSLGRNAPNFLSVFWKSKRKATFHSPGWEWLSAAPPCWRQPVVHLGWWVFHLANTTRVPHCPLPPLLGRWTPHLLQRLQAGWAAAAAPPPPWPVHGCACERWKNRKPGWSW